MKYKGINYDVGTTTINGELSRKVFDLEVVTKEIAPNLPAASADGVPIQWFAAFGVRLLNKDKSLGDYANIKYTIIMDALPAGKRLFAYYGGKLHERKFTTSGTKTRFDLEVGDPPIGFGP